MIVINKPTKTPRTKILPSAARKTGEISNKRCIKNQTNVHCCQINGQAHEIAQALDSTEQNFKKNDGRGNF